jgi:hypothetical protein
LRASHAGSETDASLADVQSHRRHESKRRVEAERAGTSARRGS